jgi:hypothetical protein
MNILLRKIADPNNLYWAWEKAKHIYKPGDIWYNELELAAFEAQLADELAAIRNDILNGTYRLQPIQPVAYPKGANEDGPRTRQTFWIAVRDQVAWLAIVNIIGRYIDARMPSWSYGNRLYISMFYEEDQAGHSELKFGYYRNTTKNLFRKWAQSWPLYRRHINISAKFLTKEEKEFRDDLDAQEQKMLDNNIRMTEHPLKSAYLEKKYWRTRKKEGLYWAGLDLEKFYPQINLAVVRENLETYLPEKYRSLEFVELIEYMLDFRIDTRGWSPKELEDIDIDPSKSTYQHLPTGLLVAGFLANVALLKVDLKVQTWLKSNRNIAHFRYVDDHVILATSFDGLLSWIDNYQKLLADSDIGTSFNPEKTTPAALAQYYECQMRGNPGDLPGLKQAAKEQCALDPDFPNPLMTQTLGKVSRIASTPFNLLTTDEEKTLIADIEHLLLTEFPDHELRKDTRVSFAARMLSVLVPQMLPDSNEVYRLHRNLCLKRTAIEGVKEEIIKAELRKDVKVILKQKLAHLEAEEKQFQKELHTEEKILAEQEERMAARTIKLLLKAVQDNHEKVRLWSRLLEFFFKSGCGKPTAIITEIRKLLEHRRTNELSLTFIHSLMLQVISTLLFEALRVMDGSNYSQRRKHRATSFVRHLLDEELLNYFNQTMGDSQKIYEQVSLDMFRLSAGAVIRIMNDCFLGSDKLLDEHLIEKYGLIDFGPGTIEFSENSIYDNGVWAWWLYGKMPSRYYNKPPFLWKKVNSALDYNNPIDQNVALLYPAHLSKNMLTRLDQAPEGWFLTSEGLLYDIYKYTEKESVGQYHLLDKIVKKSKSFTKFLSLDEWITWMKVQQHEMIIHQNEPLIFDPRLGEWAALEMIRQIAEEVKNKSAEFSLEPVHHTVPYFRYIHPHNFKVPIEWKAEGPLTWEALTRLLKHSGGRITFRAFEDMIVEDRLIPKFGADQDTETQALIRALGFLLISLLAKSTDMPARWNPTGMQQAWLNLAQHKLKDLAVSTYTRDIIAGCFSKRNLETQFDRGMEPADFVYAKDTGADPPHFLIIDDFIERVVFAAGRLKRQQLSVSGHQPRQLTPISLIQLKRVDYQILMDEENQEEL